MTTNPVTASISIAGLNLSKRPDIVAAIDFNYQVHGLPMEILCEADEFFLFRRGDRVTVAISTLAKEGRSTE
ncbi:MAG: hypothetical protein AB4050_19280 [Synechococcus sp.]